MNMQILVFGSNGLVGQSLKRTLLENKENNCFFSTRNDTNLFSYEETQKIINDFKPDLIINAAAKVGGIHANSTYGSSFLIENLKINTNVLEASLPFSTMKIINLGSSCIYPLDAKNPIKESSFMEGKLEPTNSPYAMAKLTAIELGRSLSEQYGHQVINLMPTNLYGPNDFFSDMDSHVIPALIHRMHKAKYNNEKIFHIWGSGRPLREFLYVDDLSRCIEKIIELNVEEDLLNIGSSEEISIKNLALMIKEILEFKGELQFDSSKPDGNPRKLLDSSTINRYGWKPQIQLEEGIDLTYKWYCNNFK